MTSTRHRQRLSAAIRQRTEPPPILRETKGPTPLQQLAEVARRRGFDLEPDDVAGLKLVRENGVCVFRGPPERIAAWLGTRWPA